MPWVLDEESQQAKPASVGKWVLDESVQAQSPRQMLEAIQPSSPIDQAPEESIGRKILGVGEAGLALATGLPAGLAGGITGAAKRVSGSSMQEAEQAAGDVSRALSYEPRTDSGKQITEAAGSALSALPPVLGVSGVPTGAGVRAAASQAAKPIAESAGAVRRTVSPLFQRFVKAEEQMPSAGTAEGSMGAAATDIQRQRIERAQSLPVPPKLMKGDITRDFEDQQFQRETAKIPGIGEPIRQRVAEQNAALLKNFDVFREETGGSAPDPIAVGKNVESALRQRMMAAKHETDTKYRIARENGAMDQPVPVDQLVDYYNQNFSSATNAPVIGVLGKELKRLGAAAIGPEGELVPTGKALPLYDMEQIRQTIGDNIGPGPNMNFGPKIRVLIDQTTEGQGGQLYQDARRSYQKYAKEFKNQSAVAKVLATKPGTTDRAIAYEDIWKKAVPGEYSVQDFRNLRNSLLRAGPEGEQAFKDMQGATVDWIKQQASKNVAMDELGNPIVSAAGMRKALDTIGRDKLDLQFTKKGTQRLYDLSSVIDDLKIAPLGTVNTSNTAATILTALMESGATAAITGVPVPIASTVKFAIKSLKDRKLRAKVNQILNPEGPSNE
jgi:hypothetical protein